MTHLTVWKFTWDGNAPITDFRMPKGAEILHVDAQFDVPTIWARVNPAAPVERRRFAIVGTGHPCPPDKHIGSSLMQAGRFAFHIFEKDQFDD